jgi:hypothetical protein
MHPPGAGVFCRAKNGSVPDLPAVFDIEARKRTRDACARRTVRDGSPFQVLRLVHRFGDFAAPQSSGKRIRFRHRTFTPPRAVLETQIENAPAKNCGFRDSMC